MLPFRVFTLLGGKLSQASRDACESLPPSKVKTLKGNKNIYYGRHLLPETLFPPCPPPLTDRRSPGYFPQRPSPHWPELEQDRTNEKAVQGIAVQ